jgi:hypothetical protein
MEGMKAKAQLNAAPNDVIDVFKASNSLDINLNVEKDVIVLTWLQNHHLIGKKELTTMFDVNQIIRATKELQITYN